MFKGFQELSGIVLVAAATMSGPVAAGPLADMDLLVVGDPNGKAVVVSGSDAQGRFGARVKLPEGAFFIFPTCRSAACVPARLTRLTINGVQVPTASALRIDTRANPGLRTLTLTGRVEEDPNPNSTVVCCKTDSPSSATWEIKFTQDIFIKIDIRDGEFVLPGSGRSQHDAGNTRGGEGQADSGSGNAGGGNAAGPASN